MHKNSIIRHLAAGLLLLVFTFSVTPKQYLHELFAGHEDDYAVNKKSEGLHLDRITFRCDCNKQVVELPYLGHPDFQLSVPFIEHYSVVSFYVQSYSSAEQPFSSLRGPPVTA